MTLTALDYSYARPDPKLMAREGIEVVARYLYDNGKGLTSAERKALHRQGIGIVLNYEANSGDALLGADAGRAAGLAARTIARNLGAPKGTAIYYSVDTEVLSDAQMRSVLA